MGEQLDPELCLVAGHLGDPGMPSAVLAIVRQVEGSSRDNHGDWPWRSYVVISRVFDGATYDMIFDCISDIYHEKRFEKAPRRHAVVSVGALDIGRELRRRGVASLTQISMSDSRARAGPAGSVTQVGKIELVGALMRLVQRDLLKVIATLEDAPGLLDAMRTMTLKAPKQVELAVEERQEDPRILALQVAAWKLQTMLVRLPGDAWTEVEPMYNPLGKENR